MGRGVRDLDQGAAPRREARRGPDRLDRQALRRSVYFQSRAVGRRVPALVPDRDPTAPPRGARTRAGRGQVPDASRGRRAMSPRRFLVTGGAGFIGSALVRRLLADGHRVRVLDNGSRGSPRRLANVQADVEYLEGDVRDGEAVARACESVEVVCHLAAVNGTELFYSMPETVLDVGIRGTLNVIDAMRGRDIGELFFASSSEVYQSAAQVPTGESVPH